METGDADSSETGSGGVETGDADSSETGSLTKEKKCTPGINASLTLDFRDRGEQQHNVTDPKVDVCMYIC